MSFAMWYGYISRLNRGLLPPRDYSINRAARRAKKRRIYG
jgi:hypothetical protein